MGDRSNILVLNPDFHGSVDDGPGEGVYLYTHWTGHALAATLRRALARREGWDSHGHLARIIFCEMIKGHESEATGYCISTTPIDHEARYPLIVVHTKAQTVSFHSIVERHGVDAVHASMPFTRFVAMDDETVTAAYTSALAACPLEPTAHW